MTNGFDIDDYAALQLERRAEDVTRHYAQEFVDHVLDTAGNRLHLRAGDYEGVIRECAAELYHAGFDPQPDELDDDPVVWAFAGIEVYHQLTTELAGEIRFTDTDPVTVAGHYPVWVDKALPEDTVLMIHRDAVIPSPPADVKRPWMIKHPDGVVVADVTE